MDYDLKYTTFIKYTSKKCSNICIRIEAKKVLLGKVMGITGKDPHLYCYIFISFRSNG